MTSVETIARIRFEHFQNGKGIKRIARELGIARDTVRKVLRSGATAFTYKRTVQPQPKLGAWVSVLTEILEGEAKLPKRERRSTQRLFEELRGRGYDGAHDSVHRFVKAWREGRSREAVQAFIPLRFDPGEAYQFDWSHEAIEFAGVPLTIKVAQMRLPEPLSRRIRESAPRSLQHGGCRRRNRRRCAAAYAIKERASRCGVDDIVQRDRDAHMHLGPSWRAREMERVTANLTPALMQEYVLHYHNFDEWAIRASSRPTDVATLGEELISTSELMCGPCGEWRRKVDQRYVVGAVVSVDASERGIIGVHRNTRTFDAARLIPLSQLIH